MSEILWSIFGITLQIFGYLALAGLVLFIVGFFWTMVTNGGRKWYYYNPSKPWKGGYWEPLLPNYPPYNDYKWNPETCRFEHKETGEPLSPWQKPAKAMTKERPKPEWNWAALGIPEDKPIDLEQKPKKKRPEWVRFLLEENIGSLMEKRKRRKLEEQRDRENGTRR